MHVRPPADRKLIGDEHPAAGRLGLAFDAMTSIQPELWVDTPSEAVAFYEAAFGATVLHRVGEGDDIVAQLAVGAAAFWVAASSAPMRRLSPRAIDGATSRTLLVVDDPEAVVGRRWRPARPSRLR